LAHVSGNGRYFGGCIEWNRGGVASPAELFGKQTFVLGSVVSRHLFDFLKSVLNSGTRFVLAWAAFFEILNSPDWLFVQ
jgi:hypothetical protein